MHYASLVCDVCGDGDDAALMLLCDRASRGVLHLTRAAHSYAQGATRAFTPIAWASRVFRRAVGFATSAGKSHECAKSGTSYHWYHMMILSPHVTHHVDHETHGMRPSQPSHAPSMQQHRHGPPQRHTQAAPHNTAARHCKRAPPHSQPRRRGACRSRQHVRAYTTPASPCHHHSWTGSRTRWCAF